MVKDFIGKVSKFSGNSRIHVEVPVSDFKPGDVVKVVKVVS